MSLNNHSFSSLFKNEKIIENKRVKIGYKPTNGFFSLCDLKIA